MVTVRQVPEAKPSAGVRTRPVVLPEVLNILEQDMALRKVQVPLGHCNPRKICLYDRRSGSPASSSSGSGDDRSPETRATDLDTSPAPCKPTPLYDLMRQRLLQSFAIHADDTPLVLMRPRRTAFARVYLGDSQKS